MKKRFATVSPPARPEAILAVPPESDPKGTRTARVVTRKYGAYVVAASANGRLFGFEHAEITPDIMTLAKGLGCGVPIGAFLSKESCMVLGPGDHR